MQGTQFAQFSAEVLRRGAAAVLPKHLPDHWLDALLEEAELFAPEEWDSQEDDRMHECCAGLLGAVLVVLMEQQGHPDQLDVAVSTLMSHLHCYILALAAERVSRDTDMWLDPPTLAGVPAILLVIAALACFVPAWRAMRIDPVDALRN